MDYQKNPAFNFCDFTFSRTSATNWMPNFCLPCPLLQTFIPPKNEEMEGGKGGWN